MPRMKQVAASRAVVVVDEPIEPDSSPAAIQFLLDKASVTQLVDLENPELSELTAKFGIGSKYYDFLFPGNGSSHLGQAPVHPPLRSMIYGTHPEFIGVKYAVHLKDLEMQRPGITRRWKSVTPPYPLLTCVFRR
jgi:hypothetical protein